MLSATIFDVSCSSRGSAIWICVVSTEVAAKEVEKSTLKVMLVFVSKMSIERDKKMLYAFGAFVLLCIPDIVELCGVVLWDTILASVLVLVSLTSTMILSTVKRASSASCSATDILYLVLLPVCEHYFCSSAACSERVRLVLHTRLSTPAV